MKIIELTKKNGYLITIAASYVATLLFLLFGLRMGIFHVTQHPAFLTDTQFLMEWLPVPGGVGVYLSLFVEQFFAGSFWGGSMLVLEILIAAFLLVKLVERVFETKYGAKSLLWIAPLFVSVACINNVYFDFSIITRLVLMLAVINLLFMSPKDNKLQCVWSSIAAVAIYHCCGPLYLYCFCVVELILAILRKVKWLDIIGSLVVTAFYPAFMYRFVMPLTPEQVFYSPVDTRSVLEQYQPLIVLFFLLLPVVILVQQRVDKIKWVDAEAVNGKKNKKKFLRRQWVCYAIVIVALVGTTIGIYRMTESRRERFSARMALEAERENWQYIINNATKSPSYDRNTNFFYDLALALMGKMPDKMFAYPHLLGNEALLIEQPMAGNVCYPSSMLYYHIGQISNALHYAYESIIYYKDSPYVLRRIIDCLIISGRYTEAEMFLKQLERNMMAHRFVADRRKAIAGDGQSALSPEFVQKKHQISVKNDYVMMPPYRNFEELFLANRNNKAATDYLLSYCLLAKDLENFFNVLQKSTYNPKHLPRHYQEAVAIYMASAQNPREYASEVSIDQSINARFMDFMRICYREGNDAYAKVKANYADTYWIYYAFENPMSINYSLMNNQE